MFQISNRASGREIRSEPRSSVRLVVISHPASVGEEQDVVKPIDSRLAERFDSKLPTLQLHLVLFVVLLLQQVLGERQLR